MPNFDSPQKAARRARGSRDWPSYLIVFKLREKRTSLRRLSRLNGYGPTAASVAVHIPWPKMERLIARAIGVPPQTIWPSRYHLDGTPKSGRGERRRGKNTTGAPAVNVEKAEAI